MTSHFINTAIKGTGRSQQKLENLSPEKFGKGAYIDMFYTPSKLADNVLYRDATALKKNEPGNNKLRQLEASNDFYKQKIKQIEEQRDGIQKSLTQQIIMYKKMLQDMQNNHQANMKKMQKKFNDEIHKLIQQKEQQAKFAQSEKEFLQNKIQTLERQLDALKCELSSLSNNHDQLRNQYQKLMINFNHLKQNSAKQEQRLKQELQKGKQQYEQLSRKLFNEQVNWKNKLQTAIHNKDKEIQKLQRMHKTELQKLQNKRSEQNLIKNQQIKDLRTTFENQAKRLNEIVAMKDRMVDSLTKQNNKEKNTILQLTKKYENQINNLSHQKNRLKEEIQTINQQKNKTNNSLKQAEAAFNRQKTGLDNQIKKLREELELTQVNFVRQRDRGILLSHQLDNDLVILKGQAEKTDSLKVQNQILHRQLATMRELLTQSSFQMEKCKQQYLKNTCERDQLLIRLRQLNFENQALHRIKVEKQQQARWKEIFMMNRMYK